MKSAFGISLQQGTDKRYWTGSKDGAEVSFREQKPGHWVGILRVDDVLFCETIGSASVAACYRSLRGRVRNVMRGLERLGLKR